MSTGGGLALEIIFIAFHMTSGGVEVAVGFREIQLVADVTVKDPV